MVPPLYRQLTCRPRRRRPIELPSFYNKFHARLTANPGAWFGLAQMQDQIADRHIHKFTTNAQNSSGNIFFCIRAVHGDFIIETHIATSFCRH